MEIVIYLCGLFTAVDGCGWMRWCAKCNLHKMKFRKSLRKLFEIHAGIWHDVRSLSLPLSRDPLRPMDIPCGMRCCWWKFTFGECVCSMWNALRYIYYLLNRTKQKEKQNTVSNFEARISAMYAVNRCCMRNWCQLFIGRIVINNRIPKMEERDENHS